MMYREMHEVNPEKKLGEKKKLHKRFIKREQLSELKYISPFSATPLPSIPPSPPRTQERKRKRRERERVRERVRK